MDSKDEIYHRRCLSLATNGIAHVAPNPMVGAVIVANEKIIGEGYHSRFGGSHAEVVAIKSVKNQELLKNATLYVNLEPCSHFGKTPPCTDLIIEKGISRVVIGQTDPFLEVSGRGIQKLRNAGIEVQLEFLRNESRFLNRRFNTFHEKNRPYIILKWAETSDGFVDVIRKNDVIARPTWITDELTRALVHKWRTEEQAIMIGTNTALFDNPKLNVRDWSGRQPLRIVIDRHKRLPSYLNIFDRSQPTVVFTEEESHHSDNIEFVKTNFNNLFDSIFSFCNERKILSIFVEGGPTLLNSFICSNLWDEARVFKAATIFGSGIAAPALGMAPAMTSSLSNSDLYYYFNSDNGYKF